MEWEMEGWLLQWLMTSHQNPLSHQMNMLNLRSAQVDIAPLK